MPTGRAKAAASGAGRLLQQTLQRRQGQSNAGLAVSLGGAGKLCQAHHLRAGDVAVQHLQQKRPHGLGGPQFALPPDMLHIRTRLDNGIGRQRFGDAALDPRHRLHDTSRHGRASWRSVCHYTNHADRRLDPLTSTSRKTSTASVDNLTIRRDLRLNFMPFGPGPFGRAKIMVTRCGASFGSAGASPSQS